MKKIIFILASLCLVMAMSCASSGGGSSAEQFVLYENGQWAAELGEVRVVLRDPGDKIVEIGGPNGSIADGKYIAINQSLFQFFFANPIDASNYKRLVIVIEEGTSAAGWWGGGQLFSYVEEANNDNGDTSNSAKFGFWSGGGDRGMLASAGITFRFGDPKSLDAPKGSGLKFDPSKLNGFSGKTGSGGKMTMVKAYLE
jgi:hypothetical protein